MAIKRIDQCAQCGAHTWCEVRDRMRPQCFGCKACRYVEFCTSSIGYKFLPWMREVVHDLFGTIELDTGLRRYRRAFISMAKKNGKSFFTGALPIYHLDQEREEIAANVVGIATSVKQATEVFDSAATMIRRNPELSKRFSITPSTRRITHRDTNRSYQVLSSDGPGNDGVKSTLAIVDELHTFVDRGDEANLEVIERSSRGKDQPLLIMITTAGDPTNSLLWMREYDYAKQVADGAVSDRRYYTKIFEADRARMRDEPDFWKSKEARIQANPSHEDLGGWVRDEELVSDLQRAVAIPDKRSGYMRFTLNVPAESDSKMFQSGQWAKCAAPMRPLIDRECWAGVDLSVTTDLTAVVLVFPDRDDTYDVLPFFWAPELQVDRIIAGLGPMGTRFRRWIQDGLITTCPYETIDYRMIHEKLRWARENFALRQVLIDPAHSGTLLQALVDDGFEVIKQSQGGMHISRPTVHFRDLVLNGRIRHGGHEVLAWNAASASTRVDSYGNTRVIKAKKGTDASRIDGISALINAISGAMDQEKSVYETRGVISL